ncbi:hypothetical protein [Algibacter luteus]|uniref:hypothetical protein n=1 Tax=Algibacter luteus TaxID=1178825 RepID=UPI002593ED5E|nr:hypothetical protein [Algibacter luteus]WJJ96350.1 hypothetical protein O5O44_14140 [Algibacter luteus]
MKLLLRLICIVFTSFYCFSQSEIVDANGLDKIIYDAKKEELSGTLPFDKESLLVIKEGQDFLHTGQLYELNLVSVKWLNRKYDYFDINHKDITKDKILLPIGNIKDERKKSVFKVKCENYESFKDSILGNNWWLNPIVKPESSKCDNGYKELFIETEVKEAKKTLKFEPNDNKELHVYLPELDPRLNYEIILYKKYSQELINNYYLMLSKHFKSKKFFNLIKSVPTYSIEIKNYILQDSLDKISEQNIKEIFKSGFETQDIDNLSLEDIKTRISKEAFTYKEHINFYEEKILSFEYRGYDRAKNISAMLPKEQFVNTYFTKDYSKKFSSIFLLESELVTKMEMPDVSSAFDLSQIRKLLKLFKDKEVSHKYFLKISDIFLKNENEKRKDFFYGTLSKDNFNYHKRLKKLKENLAIIDSLKIEAKELYLTVDDLIATSFYEVINDTYIKKLKKNKDVLEKKNKLIIGYLEHRHPISVLIAAKSGSGSLKTENSKSLITDFGFVNAFAHNYEGDIKYIARPYFGLNWHFGGINKEQKFKDIKDKDFRHRWSLNVGVTVGKINEVGYRDFYNGVSPMLGINYRIDRQVRFGLGTLFVRENDPNPIVENSTVQFAPYASISFDFDLFGYVTKLVGNIF